MKLKKILLGILIIFSLVVLLMGCASRPSVGEKGSSIAVWDLDDLSLSKGAWPYLGEILSSQIIEVLKKRGDYVVVERQRLLLALKELRLGTTELVDETSRLKLGKMLGARWMVFGGYQLIGDQMRLDLRLVEVETGMVRRAGHTTRRAADLSGWMEGARKAAEELL
jgi:TolB-like protein